MAVEMEGSWEEETWMVSPHAGQSQASVLRGTGHWNKAGRGTCWDLRSKRGRGRAWDAGALLGWQWMLGGSEGGGDESATQVPLGGTCSVGSMTPHAHHSPSPCSFPSGWRNCAGM